MCSHSHSSFNHSSSSIKKRPCFDNENDMAQIKEEVNYSIEDDNRIDSCDVSDF